MRYVQIGILVCLVAIVGLLGAIYLNQSIAPPESPSEELALDLPAADLPVAEVAVGTAEKEIEPIAKPAPKARPARRAESQATATSKPRVRKAPEPVRRVEPQPAPAPVAVQPVETPPVVEPTAQEKRPIQIAGHIAPEPPPAAPEPRRVTLPPGTDVVVRLDFGLSSERNFAGDSFTASLDRDIVVDDMVIAEKGTRLEGKVVDVVRAGRVKGLAQLALELIRIDTADGQTVDLVSNRIHHEGPKSTRSDVKKVGIGAGVGALIGAIAGGGKGAAIGAGAGGGAAAATRGEAAELPAEERLEFRLMQALEIVERL
ncbi:MAG: hypothetical protein O2968_01515 [Acidobacteria bacterium]|nr:hypothetical protein [Acidobacteriota bacterium]